MEQVYELPQAAGGYERNPKRYAPMAAPRTLTEAVDFCECYWIRKFPDSVSTYMRHIREFANWAHKHLSHPCMLMQIDQHVLARYRWALENRPKQGGGFLSGGSVQLKLNTVAAMFKVLVEQGFVERNPIKQIETSHTRRQRLKREPFQELRLSTGKLQELLSYPFEQEGYWGLRDKFLLHMLGFWGVRPIEITWMQPSSLFKNTLSSDRAKRNYPGSFWVPDEFCAWVGEMEYQYGLSPTQPLFIGQYRTGITVKGIQTIVRKYGEKLGIIGLTPKDFRATVETYMDQHFEEIERDKYMGYVPSGTARKYYVKVPMVQHMFDTWVSELKGN